MCMSVCACMRVCVFLCRLWWNYGSILLSIMINVIMLVTWDAKLSEADIPENATELPAALWE